MSDNEQEPGWSRHGQASVAIDDLLDAAGRAFAELGVANATMADVCRFAGCARSTLYRYFETRRAVHLAYVNRAALRIAERMVEAIPLGGDPTTVLTDRILFGIRSVRDDPLLAGWFTAENMAIPIALSRDSEVLAALTAGVTDGLGLAKLDDEEAQRQGRWLLRSIISLLAMPADDPDEERAVVERYIVPLLVADPSVRRREGSTP